MNEVVEKIPCNFLLFCLELFAFVVFLNLNMKIRFRIIVFTQCFNIVALELSKGSNSLQAEDHNLWDVIVNGDLEEEPTPTTRETYAPPAPKTAKQLAARRNQESVKIILLLAIPDEYLLKFHNVADAKSLWEAIKSRFGGNVESKKMQKNKLISQLEVHGAPISKEDINQKFLRSLPSSWNQIALIMRNKPDIDKIDIDDLYNNLRVYEDELKRSSGSNSASQNLAFLSSENTGSTNEKELVLLMVKAAELKIRMHGDYFEMFIFELIDQGMGSTNGIRACALRNFDLGKMELENSQNNALVKLPMLKLGECINHEEPFDLILINRSLSGKTSGLDKLCLSQAQILWGIRDSFSDLRSTVLPECLTSLELKESKAYKTYLGYAIGEVPPKVARKFKKASPSKKESELVPRDEELVKKGKRWKTPAKKSASNASLHIAMSEIAQMMEARMIAMGLSPRISLVRRGWIGWAGGWCTPDVEWGGNSSLGLAEAEAGIGRWGGKLIYLHSGRGLPDDGTGSGSVGRREARKVSGVEGGRGGGGEHGHSGAAEERRVGLEWWGLSLDDVDGGLTLVIALNVHNNHTHWIDYFWDLTCADIAKITRKRFKPGKHEHGNGRAHKEPEVFYKKVLTQEAQRLLTHGCHAGNPCVPNLIQRLKNKDSMIRGMEGYDKEERLTEKGTRRFRRWL
ncbi:hypothetical protein Tco_1516422 [Tanacetum coccineum]